MPGLSLRNTREGIGRRTRLCLSSMTARTKTFAYDAARRVAEAGNTSFRCPPEYTTLSLDAATVLAKRCTHLELPGVPRMTPRVARALAKQQGTLVLDAFTTVKCPTARALASHCGALVLRHVAVLDTAALEAIGRHRGPVELPHLRPLPDDDLRQRRILARHRHLLYDHEAIDVFANIDFSRARWARIPKPKTSYW